jgi:hypothetical protein
MTSSGSADYSQSVERDEMSLAMSGSLNPGITRPISAPTTPRESSLNISVVFTSVAATSSALRKAGALAKSLDSKITLVVSQIVPYPLPLTSPPVLLDFQEKRFQEIAAASPVDIRVELYLCRDQLETLKRVLKQHSLVVIGGRKRLWPTREKNLVRKLRREGHEVVFIETE